MLESEFIGCAVPEKPDKDCFTSRLVLDLSTHVHAFIKLSVRWPVRSVKYPRRTLVQCTCCGSSAHIGDITVLKIVVSALGRYVKFIDLDIYRQSIEEQGTFVPAGLEFEINRNN